MGVAREVDGLRQQTSTLVTQLDEERERVVSLEAKARHMECEARAWTLAREDERQRGNFIYQIEYSLF